MKEKKTASEGQTEGQRQEQRGTEKESGRKGERWRRRGSEGGKQKKIKQMAFN